jgi:carboxymethylenebutenolidase
MSNTETLPGQVTDSSRVVTSDVVVRSSSEVDAYLASPAEGAGRRGGIIVIHEAFGPNDHIHDLARRFANVGFDALAPNLYSRVGAPDPTDIDAVMAKMREVTDAGAVDDLDASAAHLRALPSSNGRVGVIGFCSGGRQTLLFACSSEAPDAAVDCWGGWIHQATADELSTPARPTPVLDLVDGLSCPLFIVGGIEDTNPTPEILGELERRARAAGKDVTMRIWDGAGHAFLADYRPSYRAAQAHEVWPLIVEFFQRHLA